MTTMEKFSPAVRLTLARSGLQHEQADGIVKNHTIGAMTAGMLPLPILDLVLMVNLQLNLIGSLANHYGIPYTRFPRTMLTATITGILPMLFTATGSSLLKLIPGPGSLAGNATQSTLAGLLTHTTGRVFMAHFEAGGTLDDLRGETFRRHFRRQLTRSKESVEQLQPQT